MEVTTVDNDVKENLKNSMEEALYEIMLDKNSIIYKAIISDLDNICKKTSEILGRENLNMSLVSERYEGLPFVALDIDLANFLINLYDENTKFNKFYTMNEDNVGEIFDLLAS